MSVFDSKNFNAEVFGRYLETVPRVKQNALLKAGILRGRSDLKGILVDQSGGNFINVPMSGLIGGTALNYDGNTDITATNLETFMQSMIVVGRAKAWQEKDFSQDITGHDFMADIAAQVADYWDAVDQATLLAILEGIFGVSTNGFNADHTLDITAESEPTVGAFTLNSAIQKAAGANKDIFTVVVMHSVVATNLENMQLLEYMKYNDGEGIQRDLSLATWNGRTVLVDDDVPVEDVAAAGDDPAYRKYTTYILGAGAFAADADYPSEKAVRAQGVQLRAALRRHHQPHRRAVEDGRPLDARHGHRRDGVFRHEGDALREDHLPRLICRKDAKLKHGPAGCAGTKWMEATGCI